MRPMTGRLLLAFSLLLPAAAGRCAETRNPGSFVQLVTRSWFTLEPIAASDSVSFIVVGNVYEPLLAFKSVSDTEHFEPFLAAQVPSRENGLVSEDGTTYTFPIREGVVFHSGDPLTPEDVRYSLLRYMLNDAEGAASSILLRPVLGISSTRDAQGRIVADFREAERAVRVEGGSVVVRLKRPYRSFLKVVASLPIVVSKKWAVEHGEWDGSAGTWQGLNNRPFEKSYFHEHMNGTGPYALSRADQKAGELVLRRNDGYWRKPAALELVHIRTAECTALRMNMLENGDADSGYFEDRDIRDVRELPGVRVVDGLPYSSMGEILYFNFDTDPASELLGSGKLDGQGVPPDFFKDRLVREGFAYALDFEKYRSHGMAGRGARACGPVPGSLLPCSGKAPYGYDLRKAKKAFQRAMGGRLWKEGFSLVLAFSPSNANRLVLAHIIKSNIEKLNPKFKVRLRVMPSSELYDAAAAHRVPLLISGYYADYPDPECYFFGLLHSSGYWPKAQRYSSPRTDELIEKAAASRDDGERTRLYREITRAALEDLPQVYTYLPGGFRAARSWVKGLDSGQNVSNMGFNNFPYFYVLSKE